ncbi:Transposase [Ferriphaselus amnicola]|uniref:Transposase n=1 Tax=Ferriphaselus amnicola TaxID=1188319 RepID=A0A2Z6GBW9_9PROT|nr:RNA-guided endonuclease TnpB family protein [Ferriphaselus amnicola]BBE51053.1 Transposase [Ferriphaselus amnicola]
MKRLQAFKFELQPNGEQVRSMRRFAGNVRKVWNLALDKQQKNHDAGEKFSNAFGMNNWLPAWKAEYSYLTESPSQTLQQVTGDLARAYKNFFEKRAAFPRFKKKGQSDSFRFPQGFKIDQVNSRIFLPKLGWIRYRNSREILGVAKNITVSANGGKWFVSIQTEREVEQPMHPAARIVGIDVGIARFATLSDGSYIEPLNIFRKHQQRLARYQRAMSRKTKFSSNWKKAKARVQKIHTRIANARRDFLHKTTTTISKNHAIVCIEDLQVRNMSKSAAGSSDSPGRNVKAKSGLNKSILDQGWFEFRRQLEYKQVWLGGDVLAVPARNTSRTCPACGHVSADNRQTQAKFACVDCGYENNADMVGAINVLERGHRLLACGELAQSGRSVKQEPAEVTQEVAQCHA